MITPEINFYRDENRQKMVENLARNFNAVINNALRSIRNPKEKKERRVEKEVAFILNLSKKSIKLKKNVFLSRGAHRALSMRWIILLFSLSQRKQSRF